MTVVDPHRLIESLCAEPRETEWLEFKVNNFDPEEFGRYVSALANSAMFLEKDRAYILYGVEDENHYVVGTKVKLSTETVGNEPFESLLARMLHPQTNIEFLSVDYFGKKVELVVIVPGYIRPVRFKNEELIRIGSVRKSLKEHHERERVIWQVTSRFVFEQSIVETHLSFDDIRRGYDFEHLFASLGNKKSSQDSILEHLIMEGMVIDDRQGGFDVTSLFALIASNDISSFKMLAKKAPRVIEYISTNKLNARGGGDITGKLGYARGFPRLLNYIMSKLPQKEEIIHGKMTTKYALPEKAIRELVANALIHQDLASVGDGPLIEIYSDRVKITSPGKPLVPPDRFIDAPPKSRNEKLATLMKRLDYCEGRGSGVDRALDACEVMALPPPAFSATDDSTVVTLFFERAYAAMTKEDRIRACYQHASLKFEANSQMSNGSLRVRFGLPERQYPQVSVVIKDTLEAGLIRPLDEDQANRNARYVPHWA